MGSRSTRPVADTPLAQNLWRVLSERGLTDLTAAALTGTKRTMLQSILSGRNQTSTGRTLQKIASGLGISVAALVADAPHPPPYDPRLFALAHAAASAYLANARLPGTRPLGERIAAMAMAYYPVLALLDEVGAKIDNGATEALAKVLDAARVALSDPPEREAQTD